MFYLLVCFSTIFISTRADLMYENITGVSAMSEYHLMVIIYTVFCACFFGYKTKKVYHYLNNNKLFFNTLIYLTTFIMSIGSFFTYSINGHDIASIIHVYCSMTACLSFLILLFVFNRYLLYQYPMIYSRIHWYYDLGLQFLCILIVVFTRVNGYIEIIFAILVSSYLYMIEKQFQKEIS